MTEFRLSKYKRLQFDAPEIDDETMRKFGEKLNEHIQRNMAEVIAKCFGVPAEYWNNSNRGHFRETISYRMIKERLETEVLIMREWNSLQYERALSKILIIQWRRMRSVAYLSWWVNRHKN